MTRRTLGFGFLIGLVGGTAMALFAMTAMALTGQGFFTVANLFAHTFWHGAPLDGSFVFGAFALGLAIHLTVSTIVGTVIAYLVERGQLDAGIIILLGFGVGATVWVVQAFAWSAIDADAHSQFTPWILATAHLVFAMGAATFLRWLQPRAEATDGRLEMPVAIPVAVAEPLATPRPTRSGFSRSLRESAERARASR